MPSTLFHRVFSYVSWGRSRLSWHRSRMIASFCLAVVPLVIIRILRPLIVVRFGELKSYRIARYIGEPEIYLSELDVGMHRGRYLDVFYNQPYICNYQLKKMWDRTLRVVQLARPLDLLNRRIPGGQAHRVPWRTEQDMDVHGVFARTATHLKFTREEELAAEAGLESMGVPHEGPFICFHARDSAYEVSLGTDTNDERVSPSNSDISTYLPAAEEMTRRGYFALRMGAEVEAPLSSNNPKIVDYATAARTELLDLYLGANCRFFLGSTVGIINIPLSFRRPVLHVNFIDIGKFVFRISAWPPQDLWIPKILWLRDKERPMTFREIIQSADGLLQGSWWQRDTGVDVVDNTPEEITAVVIEMEERLRRTWQSSEEDEELQRRFWSLYAPNGANQAPHARIGADFLRNHLDLLD